MISSHIIAEFLNAEHEEEEVELVGIDDLGAASPSDLAFCVYDDPDTFENQMQGDYLFALDSDRRW